MNDNQLELFNGDEVQPIFKEGKVCSKCNKLFPLSYYSPTASGGSPQLRPECRSCLRTISNIRKELKIKYGMPSADYTCVICNRSSEEAEGKGGPHAGPWVVDHCHKTNRFRGWLCHPCNRGLGNFKDNINTLQNAINYLKNS